MLFAVLLGVPLLVLGGTEFGFPNFEVDDRFTIPINQCFENVTRTSAGGDWDDTGSTYCICTNGKTLTESGLSCFYYDESGCTGNVVEEHWGGCDSSSRTITTVENCDIAQANLEDDTYECPYWIRQGTGSISMQRKIYPLKTCFDYLCDDTNSNENSRSCKMECDTSANDILQAEYSDYDCTDPVDNTDYTDINNQVCGSPSTTSPECSVTVTQWVVGDANFECGSKSGKNNFKTTKKRFKSNYIMLDNDETPYPIGQCAQVRYGYYSYSYEYICSDDGTEVYLYHYLNDDGQCDQKDEDNMYLIETYVSSNTSFNCDGSDSTGKIGYYEACDDYNWDAKYYEYLTLFGECIPLKNSSLTLASSPTADGNPESAQPWYETQRVVMSCNLNERGKTYPSVYLYVTEDCSGDYLFRWDWDDYYSLLDDYGIKKCSIPQIKGCSNGQDGVRRGNLPTKNPVCK